jgi:uncharacterized damage-inducible protein DinB
MTLQDRTIARHINSMRKTLDILGHVIQNETTERMQTLTDGADGWTVTEVMGHLLDADRIFARRAQTILTQDRPNLESFPHLQMVIDAGYKHQSPTDIQTALVESRQNFVEFFKGLQPEQWGRVGIHPEYGEWAMLDSLMQVSHHDITHLEQITRILRKSDS